MTNMYRQLLTYIIILLSSMSLFAQEEVSKNPVVNGVADLSKVDLSSNIVILRGQWYFKPQALLEPIRDNRLEGRGVLIDVPLSWGDAGIAELEDNVGYGTYSLKLICPADQRMLGFRFKEIETSYEVYANDSLVLEKGKVSDVKDFAKPALGPEEIIVPVPKNKILYLTIHVSNYDLGKAGLVGKVEVASPNYMFSQVWLSKGFDVLIFSAMLIAIFYHISIWFFRTENRQELYFILILFWVMVHHVLTNEFIATYMFPDYNWELLRRLALVSNWLSISFLLIYYRRVFPKKINYTLTMVSTIFADIFALLTLFLPMIDAYRLLIVFEIYALFVGVYIAIVIVYWLIKKDKDKKVDLVLSLSSMIIIILFGVNDILYERVIINTAYLLPIGILIFIGIQEKMINLSLDRKEKETIATLKLSEKINTLQSKLINSGNSLKSLLYTVAEFGKVGYAVLYENSTEGLKVSSIYPEEEENKPPLKRAKINSEQARATKKSIVKAKGEVSELSDYIAFPVIEEATGIVTSVLYFEWYKTQKESFLPILEMLSQQLLGLGRNFKLYNDLNDINNNLETIVEKHTQEARDQRSELRIRVDEIDAKATYLQHVHLELKDKEKKIGENVRYAARIHAMLFRPWMHIDTVFPNSFVFFRPRDIIGGDFYWAKKIDNSLIFCAADCTGHGVPGALMSIVGQNLLNKVLVEMNMTVPNEALDRIQYEIRKVISQSQDERFNVGMDLGLIKYDVDSRKLSFAGARNTAYILRKGEIIELKANKMSIGSLANTRISGNKHFSIVEIDTQPKDIIYMMSDGYVDQIGGKQERKFMRKRLKKLLIEASKLPLPEQKELFIKRFDKWRGDVPQVDDILLSGIMF